MVNLEELLTHFLVQISHLVVESGVDIQFYFGRLFLFELLLCKDTVGLDDIWQARTTVRPAMRYTL